LKRLSILATLVAALALSAHGQNVYANSNAACSGTPLVCTVSVNYNMVREVAKITLTFNTSQSPSNQNGNPFAVRVDYGPGEGSALVFAASSVPVQWGYQPGGFYDAAFTLQLGSTSATKIAVRVDFKQITSDPVLGTFWATVAQQDSVIGADLTQAY
jgi:hypothetical protein